MPASQAGRRGFDPRLPLQSFKSLRKVFTMTERVRTEFRAEFFNAFNHPVFAQPDNYITDGPGAGEQARC